MSEYANGNMATAVRTTSYDYDALNRLEALTVTDGERSSLPLAHARGS